jgi:methylthioribose-1-phosphate isomerase
MIPTLTWTPEGVRFIDQTKLPLEESYVLATTYEQVADVIVTMVVRGAPAIGVSAAYGVALGSETPKLRARSASLRSSRRSARGLPEPGPRRSISSGPSTA